MWWNERERQTTSTISRFWKALGPGLITGASDDDPSGIATYCSAGAAFGYSTLWTALLTFPLMVGTQYICAKIALVTGEGLSSVLRKHYSRKVLYSIAITLTITNALNAGADIGAIGAGINLMVPIPVWLLCGPVAILLVITEVWCSYATISQIFKWLTLTLFAYIGSALLAHPHWRDVVENALIPHLRWDKNYLTMLLAIMGTTISPYLFFWQSDQELEERSNRKKGNPLEGEVPLQDELQSAKFDVTSGIFFSNCVMFFMILCCAATLNINGPQEIATASDAAAALRPIAGKAAEVLMALGLIGSGLLAVPVLTASSAYATAEAFNWRRGLDKKPGDARGFYIIILLSTVIGTAVNYIGLDPMRVLFWSAVANGFLAPPLLFIIMCVSGNKKIMGPHVNGRILSVIGWSTTVVMSLAALALIISLF